MLTVTYSIIISQDHTCVKFGVVIYEMCKSLCVAQLVWSSILCVVSQYDDTHLPVACILYLAYCLVYCTDSIHVFRLCVSSNVTHHERREHV